MVYKLPALLTLSCIVGLVLSTLPVTAAPGPSSYVTGSTSADNVKGVNGATTLIDIESEGMELVDGALPNLELPVVPRAAQTTFIGCSIQRQRIITSTVEATKKLILSAHQFTATPGNFVSPRFVTWFGAYKESRATAVLQNWERMVAANFDTWIYTCGNCTSTSQGAVIDPAKYGEISLCSAFWNGSATFRSNVMIARLVRFDSIAGVGNSETSVQGAKDLAVKNPDKAIDNAYSYVFYANNNPPL